MKILVLNSGSSSQKSCLFDLPSPLPAEPPAPLWEAEMDWGGAEGVAELRVRSAIGERHTRHAVESRVAAIEQMLRSLWEGPRRAIQSPGQIDAVGHRIVHGGREFRESALITPEILKAIYRLAEIAPLHNRAEVRGIRLVQQVLGPVPQFAVFDTAFHRDLPPEAAVYPGPYDWFEQGIQRYGFHGINHRYCAERTAALLGKDLASLRLITCHLGNGCSLAAIRGGRSIDTTMGFTPLEGLMMGSRSGSVDPGILIHLMRKQGFTADRLDALLNRESGLLGLSGLSSDMREVLAAKAQGHARSQLAFDVFIHRLRASIGAMLASLGGLDALVFTAGIGENSPEVRAAACEPFAYLGLRLDPARNAQPENGGDVAAADSAVRVLVLHAQEDWAIARECERLLQPPSAG
jgi:acetate kinase